MAVGQHGVSSQNEILRSISPGGPQLRLGAIKVAPACISTGHLGSIGTLERRFASRPGPSRGWGDPRSPHEV